MESAAADAAKAVLEPLEPEPEPVSMTMNADSENTEPSSWARSTLPLVQQQLPLETQKTRRRGHSARVPVVALTATPAMGSVGEASNSAAVSRGVSTDAEPPQPTSPQDSPPPPPTRHETTATTKAATALAELAQFEQKQAAQRAPEPGPGPPTSSNWSTERAAERDATVGNIMGRLLVTYDRAEELLDETICDEYPSGHGGFAIRSFQGPVVGHEDPDGLRPIFDAIDVDGSDTLEPAEVARMCKQMGRELTASELAHAMKEMGE